jgi:hypothetical protein
MYSTKWHTSLTKKERGMKNISPSQIRTLYLQFLQLISNHLGIGKHIGVIVLT